MNQLDNSTPMIIHLRDELIAEKVETAHQRQRADFYEEKYFKLVNQLYNNNWEGFDKNGKIIFSDK